MATVIGVGMQMTANAAGMTKGLTEAERALQLLQKMVEQNQEAMTRFSAEADKTSASVEKLSDTTGFLATIEVGRVLADVAQSIASAFSQVASTVTGVVGPISSALDSINDLSARTGINVETLQGYSLAAKMAGVDTAAFGKAVQALTLNIGKAAPGDALDKSLKSLNLSVEQLKALAPEQQFSAIGEAISRLPTAADRAAAAVQLFGKQGAALAPLFREGAASLEELRARADRLGIIVNETQINNVAEMNDAFDLVRATIEGIIGQVIGNLAPAVTAVTEEFLRFVEEWSSTAGQGGTGIANAITDVLLEGANYFAGVFDGFSQDIEGLVASLSQTGDGLNTVGQLIFAAAESLRVIFNVFEIAGNALVVGLGKVLEGLGSWFDDDLEKFGRELATIADESAQKNAAEMEAAAANAANAFNSIFTGGDGNAKQSGRGAAQQFVAGLSEELRAQRAPEFQVATNIDETRERLNAFLAEAGEGASEFLQQSVQTLDTFKAQADAGGLVNAQMQIMNGFAERVNAELEQEKRNREQAAEASKRQADADADRVASLLKTSEAANKLEQDLAAVERERQRVEAQVGNDAQARVAELDALAAKLQEQQQALEQGFGQGFQEAFKGADGAINAAIQKAEEFGQAGFDAAQQLAEGIKQAQAQAEAGILNREAYDAEIARQQDLFNKRIDLERAAVAERQKAEEEAGRLRLQQEQLVNNLIQQQQGGVDQARVIAAQNLVAINAEILRAEEAINVARRDGDKDAERAAVQRLQQLDQVKAKEEDIAAGVAKQREEAQKAFQQQQEEAARAQQQQQQAILQEQQRIAEENRKAQEAEFARQQERLAKLNTVGEQQVNTADIRTREGAALVLSLAANAQDPQLIEQRVQTKLLQQIAVGIAGAAANYFRTPVAIVGYSSFGNTVP